MGRNWWLRDTYYGKLSWLIQEKIQPEISAKNVDYKDDTIIKQLAEKYILQFGPGPHDITGKQISVGDRVASAYATGGTLAVGVVEKIGKNISILCELPHAGKHYSCNDSQRIIVL